MKDWLVPSRCLFLGACLLIFGFKAQGDGVRLECLADAASPVFVLDQGTENGGARFGADLNPLGDAVPIYSGRVYDTDLKILAKRAELYRKMGTSLNLKLDTCVIENGGDYIHCFTRGRHSVNALVVDGFSFYYFRKKVEVMGQVFVQHTAGVEFTHQRHRYNLPFDYNGADCRLGRN